MKDLDLIRLINKLNAIYATKGVQPSELADSIFDMPYTSISSRKNINTIEVILAFTEECDITSEENIHRIKYTYNLDRYLIKISEANNSSPFKITWDRKKSIDSTLAEITKKLTILGYANNQIDRILSTLPASNTAQSETKLSLVS